MSFFTAEGQTPEQIGSELFPEWDQQSIIKSIPAVLAGCEHNDSGTYFVNAKDPQYQLLKAQLINTLKRLPADGERGYAKLRGTRPEESLQKIIQAAEGKVAWKEIKWVFERDHRELYSNEIYTKHNIPQAVCFNVDLIYNPHSAKNPHRVAIDRVVVTNQDGKLEVKRDGKFIIMDQEIVVDMDYQDRSVNIHYSN